MVTLARELTMHQKRNHQSFNAARLQRDLCGPYLSDEVEGGDVRCYLRIAGKNLPVDVPAEVFDAHRLLGRSDELVLRVPGEALARVETTPILTRQQQRAVDQWIAEMEDFDRF